MTLSLPRRTNVPDKENIFIWTPLYKALIFKRFDTNDSSLGTSRIHSIIECHFAVEEISFFEYKIIKNRYGLQGATLDRLQLEDTILGQFQETYHDDFLNAKKAWDNGLRGPSFNYALQINGCNIDVLRYIMHWMTNGTLF